MSTIRSVERAIRIISVISQHQGGIGINAIAAEIDLAKSTVSRLVATLEQQDVVQRLEDGTYALGDTPVRWVSQHSYRDVLSVRAEPILQNIAAITGEACTVCVLDGNNVLHLQQVASQQDIQVRDWTGAKLPLHVTSAGKILLAHANQRHISDYLAQPMTAYTEFTVTDATLLEVQLAAIRKQGYVFVDQEHAEGVVGIAVPVRDEFDKVIASLCVYGPAFRFDEDVNQQIIRLLMTEATKLT